MLTKYKSWRFVVIRSRISKMKKISFYLAFSFLKFKVVDKWTINLFKVLIISRLQSLSGLIEKYKLTLSKSDSSRDNLYYVRLVLVLLAVNVGKCPPITIGATSLTPSYFLRSWTVIFSFFCAISLYLFIIFLDSTKLITVWKKNHLILVLIKSYVYFGWGEYLYPTNILSCKFSL